MDLEWREEKLAEEQARGLYSLDGRDLSMELEELHGCVVGIESERTTEDVELSQLVKEISYATEDLGVFPIWDIPERPKTTQDVLTAVGLVLERLWEEHDSSADYWVQNLAHPAPPCPRLSRLSSFLLLLVWL
jgi:hypothetical protein